MAELKITSENFDSEVMKSEIPVVIDFWASWCGPCRLLAPIIAEIADDFAGKVKVGKVNVDEEPELAAAYRVMSIPTVVLIKEGEVVSTAVGYRGKRDLIETLGLTR